MAHDTENMREVVLEYVRNEYLDEDEAGKISFGTPLISSGIVDSFSMVSLKTFLERRYKISIPDSKATPKAFDTVDSIVALLKEYV